MKAARLIAAGAGLAAVGAAAAFAQYRQTEKADYTLVRDDAEFELRDYPALVVAEVSNAGTRERASGASFRRLAAYIFADDRPEGGEKIAMTAPVLQDEPRPGQWRMRFVMPSHYTLDTLPPAPEDITLTQMPARRMAALRFSGSASDRDLALMEARLRDWMRQERLMPAGEAEFAFYDAPMIPGPLRRNEVLIPVAAG